MKQNALLVAAFFTIIGIYLSPLARPGMIAGHDTGYHLTRIQLFTQALREGQFPVRWIEGPSPGITHPLFEFYPPLFYYAVAPLILIGVPYTLATYVIIILTTVLAWVGMYVFVRNVIAKTSMSLRAERSNLSVNSAKQSLGIAASSGTPPRNDMTVAALAATLFLFTPYRISELYVRAAYGELLATAFIPWAFWAIYNLYNSYNRYKNYNGYIFILAFSLAFMVTSHQPTAIIAAFPLGLWAAYQFIRTQNKWGVFRLGVAGAIAFGLSAFFILPMIAESGLIRAARLSGGYFDFRQHFALLGQLVYSVWGYGVSMRGPADGMSFQVGIVNWMVIGGAIGLLLFNLARHSRARGNPEFLKLDPRVPSEKLRINKPEDDNIMFFLTIAAFGIFMSTASSEPIWERFSLLGYIQYPWRFLLMISFATSALGGLVFYNLNYYYKHYHRYSFLLILIPILFNLKYLAPSAYMPANTFDLGNPDLSRYNSPENPFFGVELGYFPVWVNEINTDPATKRFTLTRGKADITPGIDTMIRQEAKLKVSEVSTLRVNTHYFPGWMATIHDGKTTREVIPAYNNPQGDMEINLIPGDYTLTMKFKSTPIRRIADYLSVGTLAGVAISMLLMISPKRFWSKYTGATSPARVKRSKA